MPSSESAVAAGAGPRLPAKIWNSGDKVALFLYGNVLISGGRKRLGFTYDVGPHEDDVGFIEYNETPID